MKLQEYREKKTHGSLDFPVELYAASPGYPQYIMPCHWHEECELICVREGHFDYTIDTQRGTAGPGDLLFVNSGCLHEGISRDDGTYLCVVFSLEMLRQAGHAAMGHITPFCDGDSYVQLMLPKEDTELSALIGRLLSALLDEKKGYRIKTQGILLEFFGVIVEKGLCVRHTPRDVRNEKKKRQLKKALALIETQYAAPLTLGQLAAVAGMSEKYFCHFFRQMTRRTPIDYLNHHRIEAARYRLKNGDDSITHVAYECGFNDLSYFIRVFKRYVGATPGQYAASMREG